MRSLEGVFFVVMLVAIIASPLYLSGDKKTVELVIRELDPKRFTTISSRTNLFTDMEACQKAAQQYEESNKDNVSKNGIKLSVAECKKIQ